MLNAASRAAAIEVRARELFCEDPEVFEALEEWFEFKDRLNNQDVGLIDRLKFLAERAQSKAETSIDEDDRFKGDDVQDE